MPSNKKTSPQKKSHKGISRNVQLLIFVIALVAIGAIGYYSIKQYEATQAEQVGIVICNEEKCENQFTFMQISSRPYVENKSVSPKIWAA